MITYFNSVVAFFLGFFVFTGLLGDALISIIMLPAIVIGLMVLIPMVLFSRHLKERGWLKYPTYGFYFAAVLVIAQNVSAWQMDLTPVILKGRSCDMEFQFRENGTWKISLFEMLDTKLYYVGYTIEMDTLLLSSEVEISWNTIERKLYWQEDKLRFYLQQPPNCSTIDTSISVSMIDSVGYVKISSGYYKGKVAR